jgi:hypothetical protein
MWKRNLVKGLNYVGERTRRKGSKLVAILALMAVLPGLVAGTVFMSGQSGTVATTVSPTSALTCAFGLAGSDDISYITASSMGSTATLTIAPVGVGAGNYIYLLGEVVFKCTTAASNAINTITATVAAGGFSGGIVTSGGKTGPWAAFFVQKDSGTTTSWAAVQGSWCNPTTAGAGNCLTPVGDATYTPELYDPLNTNVIEGTTTTLAWATTGAAASALDTTVGGAGPMSATASGAPLASSSTFYLLDVSYAFGGILATTVVSACTITVTVTTA